MRLRRLALLAALLSLLAPGAASAQTFAEAKLTWKLVLLAEAAPLDTGVKLVKVRVGTKELAELIRAELDPMLDGAKLALSALRDVTDDGASVLTDRVLIRANKVIFDDIAPGSAIGSFPVALGIAAQRTSGLTVLSEERRDQQAVEISVGTTGHQLTAQLFTAVKSAAKLRGADLLFSKRTETVSGTATFTRPVEGGGTATFEGVLTGTVSAGGEKLSAFEG